MAMHNPPELPCEAAEVDRYYKLQSIAARLFNESPADSDEKKAANIDQRLFNFHVRSPWDNDSNVRFGSMLDGGNGETRTVTDDLSDEVIDHCNARLNTDKNLIVKALYADIVWCSRKDLIVAEAAIDAYINLHHDQVERGHFKLATDAICRAAVLAWQLKNRQAAEIIQLLISSALLSEQNNRDPSQSCVRELGTFVSKNIDHFERTTVSKFAKALREICDMQDLTDPNTKFFLLRDLSEIRTKFHIAFKDDDGALSARIAIGQYMEAEARARGRDHPLIGAMFLTRAIDHYNSIGESRRARSLSKEAQDAGNLVEENMGEIKVEGTLNMEPYLDVIRQKIEVEPVDALEQLACWDVLIPSWQSTVEANVEESILAFMPVVTFSHGRQVHTSSSPEEISEKNTLNRFEVAEGIANLAFTICIEEIQKSDSFTIDAIVQFLSNGVVFDSMELELTKRCFEQLLDHDYFGFIHSAAPRAEALLVKLAAKVGERPTVRSSGRTRRIDLETALNGDALKNAAGDDAVRWLKFVLSNEGQGLNLRNDVAHGLIEPKQLGSENAYRLAHILLWTASWHENEQTIDC